MFHIGAHISSLYCSNDHPVSSDVFPIGCEQREVQEYSTSCDSEQQRHKDQCGVGERTRPGQGDRTGAGAAGERSAIVQEHQVQRLLPASAADQICSQNWLG